jgi:hypothetical protein
MTRRRRATFRIGGSVGLGIFRVGASTGKGGTRVWEGVRLGRRGGLWASESLGGRKRRRR